MIPAPLFEVLSNRLHDIFHLLTSLISQLFANPWKATENGLDVKVGADLKMKNFLK